ncbi:MAG: hypothetical protein R2789_19015 [Microthrixaceae bacterium]
MEGIGYDFTPLSHLRRGMQVLVESDGSLEQRTVDSVEFMHYSGPVFDLEVDTAHSMSRTACSCTTRSMPSAADIRNMRSSRTPSPTPPWWCWSRTTAPPRRSSTPPTVIAHNAHRKPKELWSDSGRRAVPGRGPRDRQTQWVAHKLGSLHQQGDVRADDMKLFYRTNAQSRVVEESLMRRHPLPGGGWPPLL